jgi:hypothetical protein
MTVVADSKKRLTIRSAKPGDRFDVHITGEGRSVLTRIEPVSREPRAKVKIAKRGGYSVGVLDRPIDESALAAALREFS